MRVPTRCILTILTLGLSAATDKITAPDRALYLGDFEAFSCQASTSNLMWMYKFKYSTSLVPDSEILLDKRTSESDTFFRKSLIRIPHSLQGIACFDASKQIEVGTTPVTVNEFKQVDLLEEPNCDNVPKISLVRWAQSSQDHVWLSHYITNEDISLQGVSGIKLTCFSTTKVNWTITREKLQGFRYWTSERRGGCHIASLVLSPINPTSAQKFTCITEGHDHERKESSVNIILSPTRYSDDIVLDFNKTQECIEYLGTTVFGSQTLAWTTTGTSVLSIGMMVGIVFLKKQLEKQKTNNNSTEQNQTTTPTV